jgi:hypothetical protein
MTGVQDKKSKQSQTAARLSIQAEKAMALLKTKIARLQKELEESHAGRRGSLLAHVRQIQNDPKWRERVRAQYTPAVSQRTLKLNNEFPLPAE